MIIIEKLIYLGIAAFVLVWLVRFVREFRRDRAKSARMDAYMIWVKKVDLKTDPEAREHARAIVFGENPDYRGPWEQL